MKRINKIKSVLALAIHKQDTTTYEHACKLLERAWKRQLLVDVSDELIKQCSNDCELYL